MTQVAGTAVNMTGNGVTATFNGFTNGVTLANSANVLGAIAISNVGPLSIQENAPITQASVWSNGNSITLATTNDQAITLNQSGNYLRPLHHHPIERRFDLRRSQHRR